MGSGVDVQILSRSGNALTQTTLTSFKSSVQGKVVVKGQSDEDTYRAAINRHNKASVAEAGIVVFVQDEQDIASCLQFVQKNDLDMTIACGRHSYYKASTTKGGLVIDLSMMKNVSIDQEKMSVTAQGGCKAVDLEAPLQELGLMVVTGAANDTGIGSLTLEGGSGYLTRQYGLVIDNLLAAKVVIADGSVLEASEEKNTDMFWGIRGGGSNFGIVTEFTFKIHKVVPVWHGPMAFTPDKLRAFLELAEPIRLAAEASNGKFVSFFALTKAPNMPSGPKKKDAKIVQPLLDLGPVMNMVQTKSYLDATSPNSLLSGPPTHQHYSTSNAPGTNPLDVELVIKMAGDLHIFMNKYGAKAAPSKIAIELRSYAKSAAVSPSATALRARAPGALMAMEAQHDGTTPEDEMRAEVKKIIGAVKAKGGFIKANIGDGSERVAEMYGENFERLRLLKRRYDPNMVFNKWYPILPTEV